VSAARPGGAAPAGRVIVLTGPPGAGKTTVARLLTERLVPSVHLHADDFWRFIRRGWIAPYLPQAHLQNQTVIEVLAGAAYGYAAGGYEVVCDGVVGPWFLDVFRAARPAAVELHYVILRPDRDTTMERAVGRSGDALTEPEPITSLHRQFSGLGDLEPHVLDSSRISPQTTAGLVLRGLARGTFRMGGGG
jgi:chloramphenicol 3-O-phosphotransferase